MPDHTAGHEPELLTITEAAELLRAPVATLRYWRHLNTGPRSFRLGRVLYRRADLHTWITYQHDVASGPTASRRIADDTSGAQAPGRIDGDDGHPKATGAAGQLAQLAKRDPGSDE